MIEWIEKKAYSLNNIEAQLTNGQQTELSTVLLTQFIPTAFYGKINNIEQKRAQNIVPKFMGKQIIIYSFTIYKWR